MPGRGFRPAPNMRQTNFSTRVLGASAVIAVVLVAMRVLPSRSAPYG